MTTIRSLSVKTQQGGYRSGILACIAKSPTLDRLGSTRKNQYVDTVFIRTYRHFKMDKGIFVSV